MLFSQGAVMGWYIMATVDILWQSQEAVFYSVKNFSWPCKNVPDVTCKNVPDVSFGPYKIDKVGMSRRNCSSSSRVTFFLLSCGPLKAISCRLCRDEQCCSFGRGLRWRLCETFCRILLDEAAGQRLQMVSAQNRCSHGRFWAGKPH